MCWPPNTHDVVRVRFQMVMEQLEREIAMWEDVLFPGLIAATPESSDWGSDDELADLPSLEDFLP